MRWFGRIEMIMVGTVVSAILAHILWPSYNFGGAVMGWWAGWWWAEAKKLEKQITRADRAWDAVGGVLPPVQGGERL